MLHTAETQPKFSTLKETNTDRATPHGLLAVIRSFAHGFSETVSQAFTRTDQIKRWNSESYLNPELPLPTRIQRFHVDVRTFLHEYVGMFSKKIYPYSKFGLLNGYDIPVSQVCKNFEDQFDAEDPRAHRAQLETWVAEILEAWMADPTVPTGGKLVCISPRGSFEEGYPGEKGDNYVFVNIYQKIGETKFQLIQFTSYGQNQELGELTEAFRELGGQDYQPVPLPFYPQKPSHQLISETIKLPPKIQISQLESAIYERKNEWPIKIENLPELDEVLFNQQLETVVDFCTEQLTLLDQIEAPVPASTNFDLLIEIVRQDFLKWVEDHATNYQRLKTTAVTEMEPYAISLKNIEDRWQLRIKEGPLTQEERSYLQQLTSAVKLNPLVPLGRLASTFHCVVGTPGSLALQVTKGVNISPSVGVNMSETYANFTQAERLNFSDLLDHLTRISVINRQTGQSEVWYVLIGDPKDAHFYVNGCYRESATSPIMGPCGVPLFEDSLIDSAWLIPEAQYQELRRLTYAQNLEQALLTGLDSDQDKARLRELIDCLYRKLFRVTFSDLVAGMTGINQDSLYGLPPEYLEKLFRSHHPIKTLEELLEEPDSDQNKNKKTWWASLAPELISLQAA